MQALGLPWLAVPSRFAAFGRPAACLGLGLLVLLLAAALAALVTPGPPPVSGNPALRAEDQTDVILYETIVSGVRAGGDYYAVTADALRAGNYPLKPFVTFRLPTLALAQAGMPQPVMVGLLLVLAAAVMLAWFVRLRLAFVRPVPLTVAMLLLAGGMAAFVQFELVSFHEVWAGLLIALSLALRRPGRWIGAVALGLLAMLIRETALLYVGIMGILALAGGHRREALGWAATIVMFGIAVALHAHAVSEVVRPGDPVSPGWSGLLGFGFFVKTMTLSTALGIIPAWMAAPLVGLALFGWAAWDDAVALRALALFCAYAALLGIFGRVDTFYWGLMVAPTILIGLAFAPDGLRDLAAAARSRP